MAAGPPVHRSTPLAAFRDCITGELEGDDDAAPGATPEASRAFRDSVKDRLRVQMNLLKAGLDKRGRSFTQSTAGRRWASAGVGVG